VSGPATVYVSIGNSDNKLTQVQWAQFCQRVVEYIQTRANAVFGEWYSKSDSRWQNAVICFEVFPHQATVIQEMLRSIAYDFHQESIAWAETPETVFLSASRPPAPARPEWSTESGVTFEPPQ